MTEALRRAIELIEQLPASSQDAVAEKLQTIAAELADQRWDELFADPRSDLFFEQMIAEIEDDRHAGELLPWPGDKDVQG